MALISRDRGEVITIRSRKTEACSEGSAYLEEGAAASGHVDRNSYLTYSLSSSFSTIFLPVLFTSTTRGRKLTKRIYRFENQVHTETPPAMLQIVLLNFR